MRNESALTIRDLSVSFSVNGVWGRAVDRVSIDVPRGTTVAIVGESGSGKSVTAMSVLNLLPQPPARIDGGEILLRDPETGVTTNLRTLSEPAMQHIRGRRIALVFQDALGALNPVLTIGAQVQESITLHESIPVRVARQRTMEVLARVELPEPTGLYNAYPHQLSGGMRQRVLIAMALACDPQVLIADEPTTALDVTIQAQILALLAKLQRESKLAVLLITHDFGVVAQVARYVYVMYAGCVAEQGPVHAILTNPLHPYTIGLLECVPQLDALHADTIGAAPSSKLPVIDGHAPGLMDDVAGCSFHPRCRRSVECAKDASRRTIDVEGYITDRVLRRCVQHYDAEPSGKPALVARAPDHLVACWEA